jgi:hypothetical protein
VYSQEALPVSVGEATGFGGSGSYTVGQVFYTSHTATTGVVLQGVQQLFELQTLSNPALTAVNLSVFPIQSLRKILSYLKLWTRVSMIYDTPFLRSMVGLLEVRQLPPLAHKYR